MERLEFRAKRLRMRGQVMQPWQGGGYDVQGLLTLREELDQETRRQSRVARVAGVDCYGKPVELLLRDALLIHISAGLWTMTGFERIDDGLGHSPATYLQS